MAEPAPTASGSGEPPKEPSKNALKKAQKEKEKVHSLSVSN
jgi:aspartyl-tRNA synthetase